MLEMRELAKGKTRLRRGNFPRRGADFFTVKAISTKNFRL
jgi:hypothetical protein